MLLHTYVQYSTVCMMQNVLTVTFGHFVLECVKYLEILISQQHTEATSHCGHNDHKMIGSQLIQLAQICSSNYVVDINYDPPMRILPGVGRG